jgi:exopolysaccharide biosynthesis predicted pyruvyltransferase EpsI
MQKNKEVISKQVSRLKEVIGQFVQIGTQYALIDFPDHSNVGDSAIWLGEIKLLKELTGNAPKYVSTVESFDYDELMRTLPSGPILIHGGGNFGDIWRTHQDFREMILAKFKDRLVVQLPQSIKFQSEASISLCADNIAAHPNFHLLVRDQPSLNFVQQYFACDVQLVPDSAFAIQAIDRPTLPASKIFMLLRTDSERAEYDEAPLKKSGGVIDDWLIEPSSFYRQSRILSVIRIVLNGAWSKNSRRLACYQQLAEGRLDRGLRLLSSGECVITDRLHAHILSILLDIPHVALDNNYGKVSGYINAWTSAYPNVRTATTAEEALDKLSSLS